MGYRKLSRDERFMLPGPKRVLALDGGGLRGILTLGFLGRIEALLCQRHGGDPNFRLAHYFDLIAGTSTGAIIAAALAKGMRVDTIVDQYLRQDLIASSPLLSYLRYNLTLTHEDFAQHFDLSTR